MSRAGCPWAPPGRVSWWVLGWSQLTKLPAGDGAEAAGVLSEQRNGGKDGEREKAIPSTSFSFFPSGLHAVRSSYVCQTASGQLLNCPDLFVLGSDDIHMVPLGFIVFFSVQVGTDSCPVPCCHCLGFIPASCRDHNLQHTLLRLWEVVSYVWGHTPRLDRHGSQQSLPSGAALLPLCPDSDCQKKGLILSCWVWAPVAPEGFKVLTQNIKNLLVKIELKP